MADIFFKPSHEDLADERKKALKGTTVQQMRQHTCPYSQKRPGSLQAVRALLVEPEKIRDKQTA